MKKKIIIGVLLILFAIIVTAVIMVLSNPLRRSAERIRDDMLELTPIGMSMEDVLEIIESNDRWEIKFVSHDFGFYRQEPNEPRRTIGRQSIRAYTGRYRNLPFVLWDVIVVDVFWGFDENSELIDIWVWKQGLWGL